MSVLCWPLVSVSANRHTRSAASSSWRSRTAPRNDCQWRTFTTGWSHTSPTLQTPQRAGRTPYDTTSRSTSASRKLTKTRVRWVKQICPTHWLWLTGSDTAHTSLWLTVSTVLYFYDVTVKVVRCLANNKTALLRQTFLYIVFCIINFTWLFYEEIPVGPEFQQSMFILGDNTWGYALNRHSI